MALCALSACVRQASTPASVAHSASYELRDCPYEQCDDAWYGEKPRSGVYRGTYWLAFERSSFDDGSKCQYWLSGNLDSLIAELEGHGSYAAATARIEVEGTLSPPGCYGHLGKYRRELTVTEVISFSVIDVEPLPTPEPEP